MVALSEVMRVTFAPLPRPADFPATTTYRAIACRSFGGSGRFSHETPSKTELHGLYILSAAVEIFADLEDCALGDMAIIGHGSSDLPRTARVLGYAIDVIV